MDAASEGLARELAASAEVRSYLQSPGRAAFVGTGTGKVLWASPDCAAVLGHEAQDLLGRNAWALLIPPEDIRSVAELRALMSEGDSQVWARYKAADGSRHWYQVEILARRGLYVALVRREADPAMQRWHGRPRPASAV